MVTVISSSFNFRLNDMFAIFCVVLNHRIAQKNQNTIGKYSKIYDKNCLQCLKVNISHLLFHVHEKNIEVAEFFLIPLPV